ncbi:TonB-dependent receptor [Bradyrhizobium sp.]|uniref:TonB-dependent receptor n=1 Tax=Bradyrhizobium sp. TaxID=376 RepID=UPI0026217A21|nr:TonB-dependent receptor [Bradyrhizobium sp.]
MVVTSPNRKPVKRAGVETARTHVHARTPSRNRTTTAATAPAAGPSNTTNEPPRTPLNSNVVAASATRLGLTAFEMPASVDVVDRQTMQEQGYRTTTETAQGAVGVLAGDSAGAPANFSMRGFTGPAINTLYNGIWIGPSDITNRIMDTSSLDRVEVLKGPSSIMSGLDAIGGAVNYVSRQPTSGPIRNEFDASFDLLGTYRTHYGSGGSTLIDGLDYRVDIGQSRVNSFIDGDYTNLSNFSTQFNYRVTDSFKVFAAIEYKQDQGHAYWGTPLTTTTFSGPFSKSGVVSGSALNTFDGVSIIAPVTVDSRTLTTNYNVADNSVGAQELWLRSGFEWNVNNNLTVKNQVYDYNAQRHWFDSETYAFDGVSMIDRGRFFVQHNQHVYGDNTNVTLNNSFFGMENRLALQLQASRNDISFAEEGNPNAYPFDSVSVVNPDPGVYGAGVPQPDYRTNRLDTFATAAEDRLKINSMFSLIGGVRFEDFQLSRDGIDTGGAGPASVPAGLPFTANWAPVSYRAAYTFEPVKGLMFYSLFSTAYDPAAAGVFSITPGSTLALTSAKIYETGVKRLFWDNRAEWTLAAYDITRNNVYVQITDTTSDLAGEIRTKGVELSGAVRPIDNLKLWGNVAYTDAKYANFILNGADVSGNTPSNVAPIIVNAGASYRFSDWRWPVEFGGAVRHVGNRYLFDDDATTMLAYTTADLFAFVDIPGKDLPWQGLDTMRVKFQVRNITNAVYAQWSDTTYPDQVLLGAPRTFELLASAKW